MWKNLLYSQSLLNIRYLNIAIIIEICVAMLTAVLARIEEDFLTAIPVYVLSIWWAVAVFDDARKIDKHGEISPTNHRRRMIVLERTLSYSDGQPRLLRRFAARHDNLFIRWD